MKIALLTGGPFNGQSRTDFGKEMAVIYLPDPKDADIRCVYRRGDETDRGGVFVFKGREPVPIPNQK